MNYPNDNLNTNGQSEVAIIGLPYDKNSSFLRGAAEAPPRIREALFSDSSNMWTESGLNLGAENVLLDVGDLDLMNSQEPFVDIQKAIALLLERQLKVICLGGDHSITYPVMKALRERYQRISILHFDAHPDLYDDFQGNRYSHASPFARIMEEKLTDRLVQVGIRTMNGHQSEQAKRFGVEVVDMRHWRRNMKIDFETDLYLSFDVDALDPAFAPGVSHHEPGGLSTREVIDIIQSVKVPVIGADIVEFNPRRDIQGMTSMVCAKLLKEMAAKMIES